MAKLSTATFYPADPSNYDRGRQGNRVDRITVHHTAGYEDTLRHLYANPRRNGSAHFFVHPGKIEQYVDTNDTAWTNSNYSSNLRAVTIEVRGDWRTYYDKATLNQLRRLFTELRRLYPKARLTYHMDEASPNRPTACPANLKHKGYALKEWNAALNIPGGSEVANRTQVNNIYKAVLHREGDPGGLNNYTGRDANSIVSEMLGSAEFRNHDTFIKTASRDINSLKENNRQKDGQIIALNKALSQEKTDRKALQQQLDTTAAALEECKNKEQPAVDEQEAVEGWFKKLISFIIRSDKGN